MTNQRLQRISMIAVLVTSLSVAVPPSRSSADDALAATFDSIIAEQTRATFDRVARYVTENNESADVERAWQWLFLTAINHGLEAEAIDLARTYVKSADASAATRAVAQQTLAIGLAKSGKSDEAIQLFTSQLRFARFQSGGTLIEFGRRLATQLRLSRDFDAARQVYEEISSKFFLNADVRSLCDNRVEKIRMIDLPAPGIEAMDLAGGTVSLSSLQGKVVLLDFWATNCPPCIEEMPNIKQIYSVYHDRGFEVIGVSLDEDPSIVEQFTSRMDIPWPMVVDPAIVETLRASYHVPTIPSLFVIDRAGNLHQFDVRGRDLRKVVEQLMMQ